MTASAVAAPGLRRSLRPLGLLTGGHMVTDLAQGSVPALLPFLRNELHLSYTRTAAIMLAATIASSVVQPIFGHLFDTRRGEWLLVAGPAVAGLGIGALAFAHTFAVALACVLIGSLGVAAFHPEASKFAAWLSGDRRSTAMSVFSVGGNLGVALGPLLAGLIASQYGLGGVWLLAIPGLAIGVAQLAGLAALGGATEHARVRTARAGRDRWGPTGLLLVALAVRGYVHFGLLTFIPLLEHDARHNSRAYGSRVLALMLFAGAVGTLAAGPLADRYGRLRVLTLSFLAGCPGVALYLADSGCARPRGDRDRRRRRHLDVRHHDRRLAGVPADPPLDGRRTLHRPLDRPRRRRLLRDRHAGRLDRARRRALDDPAGGAARDRPLRAAAGAGHAAVHGLGGRRARDDALEALAGQRLDLLVVGGGIVGCAVAWLGARAGLRVALVERGDLAGATSSASSKLIHGGLRYLQMGDIGLVREAHAERHALARVVAPHLVRPRAFLVPVYRGGLVRATTLRAGLVLYGGLGRFEDGGGSLLRPRAARALVPPLRTAGLRSAGRYVDHETNDARMTIAVARAAALAGAQVATRVEVRSLRLLSGRVAGAECVDVAQRQRSSRWTRRASSTRRAPGSTSCGGWPIPPPRARCASRRARTSSCAWTSPGRPP